MEPTYLAAIRNRATKSLQGTIYEILEHLQTSYGAVTLQMQEDKEIDPRVMTYNPRMPINTVINAVEDLVEFADLGGLPMTKPQAITHAYIIINKTCCFKVAITEWNRTNTSTQTLVGFKQHFRLARKEFRDTTDLTLEESELEQQNTNLVQHVVERVADVMTVDTATTHKDNVTNKSILATPMANHATDSQQQIPQQLADIPAAMATLQAQFATPQLVFQPYYHQQRGRGGLGGCGNNGGRGGRGAQRKCNLSKYC